MGPEERAYLLRAARAAVEAELKGMTIELPPPPSDALNEPSGVFVSVHTDGQLRGCTGFIRTPMSLVQAVMSCAVSAATADPRFRPLSADELDRTLFEISVLSPPAPIDDPTKIEIGRHGIIITKGPLKGLLLPQVAPEHGFTIEEFLDAGCRKAQLPPGAWRDPDVTVEVFTAEVFAESSPSEA